MAAQPQQAEGRGGRITPYPYRWVAGGDLLLHRDRLVEMPGARKGEAEDEMRVVLVDAVADGLRLRQPLPTDAQRLAAVVAQSERCIAAGGGITKRWRHPSMMQRLQAVAV